MDLKHQSFIEHLFKKRLLTALGLGFLVSLLIVSVISSSSYGPPSLFSWVFPLPSVDAKSSSSAAATTTSPPLSAPDPELGMAQFSNVSLETKSSSGLEKTQDPSFKNSRSLVRQDSILDSANTASTSTTEKAADVEVHRSSSIVMGELSKTCNIFDGRWVRDEREAFYPAGSCPLIDVDFDCYKNGRPDDEFLRWRWQPNRCDIPR